MSDGKVAKIVVYDKDFILSDDFLRCVSLGQPNEAFSHGWYEIAEETRIFVIFKKLH